MKEINHWILGDPTRTQWGLFSYILDLLDRLTAHDDADQQKIKNMLMGKKILALICIDGYWCVVPFLGVKKLGEKKTRGEMLTVSAVCFVLCVAFILLNLWLEMPLGSVRAKLKTKLNSWIALWLLERALFWHPERSLCESLCLKVRDRDCKITFLDRLWHALSPRKLRQKTTGCKALCKAKRSLILAKTKWVIGKNRGLSKKGSLYSF